MFLCCYTVIHILIEFIEILDASGFEPKFNKKDNTTDGEISRISFHDIYDIHDELPRNPAGRTGVENRGLLNRWGVNHAADCIVTRWKRKSDGSIEKHPIIKE